MKVEDFFDTSETEEDIFGFTQSKKTLKSELVKDLLNGPVSSLDDLSVAEGLIKLTHQELEAYGTGGGNVLDDEEILLVIRTARVVCNRVGLKFPSLPFRNFTGFYSYWKRNGMTNSWAARRDYLAGIFEPVENEIFELEERQYTELLAKPVTPRGSLGWSDIDREIEQLRRRFASAKTEQDYTAIGSACVRIQEAMGDVVYDASKHTPEGMSPLSRDKTKLIFEAVIETSLQGSEMSAELKRMAKSATELAHKVKHTKTPNRTMAGVACDATILLANILRRLTI